MADDEILSLLKLTRARAVDVADRAAQNQKNALNIVAQMDELIKRHEGHLKTYNSDQHVFPMPSPLEAIQLGQAQKIGITNPAGSRRPVNLALQKATRDTALEMLRNGANHVRTGEVMEATIAKGFKYPDKEPSKYAYQYLKGCPELENFKLANAGIFAWRLREQPENTRPQHSAGVAA